MKKCLASERDAALKAESHLAGEMCVAAAAAGEEAAQEEVEQEEAWAWAALAAVKCRRLFTLHKAETKKRRQSRVKSAKAKVFLSLFRHTHKIAAKPINSCMTLQVCASVCGCVCHALSLASLCFICLFALRCVRVCAAALNA